MTYTDLLAYIKAGVQNGSWSASAAADAREFLTKNREEIRQKMEDYEEKMAEARANGLKDYANLIEGSMDTFMGHLIRQAATANDASVDVFKDSVKEADRVIDDLTFKTIEKVPGSVQVLLRQIKETDQGDIHDLLSGSRFANADMFEPTSAGNLSGASGGQYLVAKALLDKSGQSDRVGAFQSPGLTDAAYKDYQAKFDDDDPEFTSYSWAQNYVDGNEALQSQIDEAVESMLDPLGIPKADLTQQGLLRDVIEGTAVRGVQLEVAKRDKAAFQALVDKKKAGGKVNQSDIDAALRSAHSLSLTKHGILGDSAEGLVQREQSKLKDPTGGMTAEEATVARFGDSVMDTLEYDRIALLDGVDSSGRPLDKYKSKKDVLDSTIGKAYLKQVDLRKKLADNPSFAEYARSRGLNVLPGQMPTPGQMRRFGRAIRQGTRRPVQPSGVTAELIVVDPDRTVTLGEGAEARRVSFTVTDKDGNTRYLTKEELEERGNEALGDTKTYPIREIDLDNQNARDLLAQAVPGLASEMQVIDKGYRSSNDALAKRFEGSSVLVDVNTGKVVLIGQDRKVVKTIDAPEQIAQLKTYASNPEYAAIAADNARSRKGDAGNALMAFDDRFKEGLRVDDVGIAIPEGVTLTAEVARKKITGELGRRKTGQSMAEFNMIGRDEDGNPTYSVINVRDILEEPKALPPEETARSSRRERRTRRKAGAPGKRGRATYREEALPPLQQALQAAPAPAPAAEPAPAEEGKKEAAPPKSKSGLAERPSQGTAKRPGGGVTPGREGAALRAGGGTSGVSDVIDDSRYGFSETSPYETPVDESPVASPAPAVPPKPADQPDVTSSRKIQIPIPAGALRPLVRQIPAVKVKDAEGQEITTSSGEELLAKADAGFTKGLDYATTPLQVVGEPVVDAAKAVYDVGRSGVSSIGKALRYAGGLEFETVSDENKEDEEDKKEEDKKTDDKAQPAT